MQVVIALPATGMERLETPVCGVPLLTRVVATAVRAGASEVLLVTPTGLAAYLADPQSAIRSDQVRDRRRYRSPRAVSSR